MITSPYNFVPLSDKVVMPFWAKHISHDIPFKDAQSGILKLKIKAESPIYVRNGVPQNMDKNDSLRNDFNQFENKYFIPGSSVKGMLRSVMEIMSFGRMANKVNQDKYSVRDFQNNNIYQKTDLSNKVECGWLYKIGDEYFIDKCGKPGRISHKNLDVLCKGQKISSYYKVAENVKKDSDKSAKSKNDRFTFGGTKHNFSVEYTDAVGKSVYKIDKGGDTGTIVLTGQASVRKELEGEKASGKHLEFIFWDKTPTKTPVSDEAIKNFFFAYYDHDKTSQKDDWRWRKPQLEGGEKIPVFYRVDEKGDFIDLGLTMLYKITYKNSVLDLINNQQKNAGSYDLAEAIFGYAEKENALKGRVHVGHAFVSNHVQPLDVQSEVLAGPKASYYPNYIKQSFKNGTNDGEINKPYQTYMNDAKISGWKRYPVRSGASIIPNRGTEKVSTKFIPLPVGTEFTLDIGYHNLRKEELGALISAITFHNTKRLYHSIGSAKPLGYGKVSIELSGIEEGIKIEMLKAYEGFMDYSLNHSAPLWFQCEQIKELFAMAKPGNDGSKLQYMELAKFAAAKGRGRNDPSYALQEYSVISKNHVRVESLNSLEELIKAKETYQTEERAFANLTDVDELKGRKLLESEDEMKRKMTELKDQLLNELKNKQTQVKENEVKKKSLSAGINLNALSEKKTVESLLRALKYWKETLKGNIGSEELEKTKERFGELFMKLKQKDPAKWIDQLCNDLSKLRTYFNENQLSELKSFVESLKKK